MAATLKDLARETGISIATISKYLNGVPVREKNKIAIDAAIRKLDYSVNEYARSLKSNKSRSIGVVIPALGNEYTSPVIFAAENVLRQHGYSTLVCDSHSDENIEKESVKFLMSKMVDGIIIIPCVHGDVSIQPAIAHGTPVVVLDQHFDSLDDIADQIVTDNEDALYRATKRLIGFGHTKIGIAVGATELYTPSMRLAGYKRALQEAGIPVEEKRILRFGFSGSTVKDLYDTIYNAINDIRDMTAILATTYESTLSIYLALRNLGMSIPEDMAFIGFDKSTFIDALTPRLTIVEQPLEQLGTLAANRILSRLNNPEEAPMTIKLNTHLTIGESDHHEP